GFLDEIEIIREPVAPAGDDRDAQQPALDFGLRGAGQGGLDRASRQRQRHGSRRMARRPCSPSSRGLQEASTPPGPDRGAQQRAISSRASAKVDALRYGRSLVIASSVSAIMKMRAPSGRFAPASPRG